MEIDAILNESKYRPPSLFEKQVARREIMHTKHFFQSAFAVSIRPFVNHTDLPFVAKMFHPHSIFSRINAAASAVAASYLYSGTSDFARSFVCLLDGNVVCSVDICEASKDELYDAVFLKKGDYVLRLLVPPKEKTDYRITAAALTTFMEYFFLFPEVVQLFIELCDTDKDMIELVQECGFRIYAFRNSLYSPVTVFYADRQHLIV
ncbi:MAG TPA: GNAT family N-acetyltransferase [Niastella sp.]